MTGRYFVPSRRARTHQKIAPILPGYHHRHMKATSIKIQYVESPSHFIPLQSIRNVPLDDYNTFGSYLTKLPLMMINSSRLLVTNAAFKLAGKTEEDAIKFYITVDLNVPPPPEYVNDLPDMWCLHAAGRAISQTLDRLRSSGYIEYWLNLANTLNLNLEIVSTTTPDKYFKSDSIGYLVVYHDIAGNEWYAAVNKTPTYCR